MINFTEQNKKDLQAIVEAGSLVGTLCYNPNTVQGTPETDATDDGWVEFYREDTATRVEIIYTKAL